MKRRERYRRGSPGEAEEPAVRARARALSRGSAKSLLGVAVVTLALLAFALSAVNFFYAQAARPGLSTRPYRVDISRSADADMRPIVESYMKANPDVKMEITSGDLAADVYIDSEPRKGFDSSVVTGLPPLTVEAGSLEKTLRPAREYLFCRKRTGVLLKVRDKEMSGLEDHVRGYWDSLEELTITGVGDIIPGRHVAENMARRGAEYPFEKIAPLVRSADLSFGNLECPLTDSIEPPYSGMQFSARTGTMKGINLLGLDVVTLANNHSTNFGRGPFEDTLEVLEANSLEYVGGGRDYARAHEPVVVAAGGYRFAFLDYNAIEGSVDATADQSGVSWVDLKPWREDNPAHFRMVAEAIKAARAKADFVIVAFHWNEEYVYEPNPSMVKLARMSCDAGADMVVGQHPHTIQPIEYYKGKLIAYSLGNFVFDQRFNEQVRQGFILRTHLKKLSPVRLELLPYRISGTCQTVPQGGATGQKLLDKLFDISGW